MSISNNPPSEYFDGIKYNPAFFPTNSGISLAYGTANYLSRVGTASSVATTTTFSGVVNANGGLGVTGGETVDTLNATTSLSVGGININTIYQTIAGMSSYLTTALASTTYQTIAGMVNYALLASPTFTGTPSAPTASIGTTGTQIATCDFVLNNSTPSILPLTNTFTGTSNTFNNKIRVDGINLYKGSGANNIVLGNNSLPTTASLGYDNTVVGSNSLKNPTSANNNVCMGNATMGLATTASQSVAVGTQALGAVTTGVENMGIGGLALQQTTTGSDNTAIGINSLISNTTGSNNTGIGAFSNITGIYSNSTCIGYNSLITGNNQVVLGTQNETVICLNNLTVASLINTLIVKLSNNNVFLCDAVSSLASSVYNTVVGTNILSNLTTGATNTAIGSSVLTSTTTGGTNTAVGYQILQNVTTANNNTAIGSTCGAGITTKSYNTALGYNAFATGNTFSNSTSLGANSQPTASNQIMLGTTSDTVQCPNKIKIRDTSTVGGIQFGTVSTSLSSGVTVSFPVAFTSTPIVVATVIYGGVGYPTGDIFITSTTTTYFTYNFQFQGSFPSAQYVSVNWIAICS